MSKQEEIERGLLSKIKSIRNWRHRPDIDPLSAEDDVGDILKYLHSEGVVLKVERKLPFVSSNFELSQHGVYAKIGNEALSEQGYAATEPLIEKKEIPLSELPKIIHKKPAIQEE